MTLGCNAASVGQRWSSQTSFPPPPAWMGTHELKREKNQIQETCLELDETYCVLPLNVSVTWQHSVTL